MIIHGIYIQQVAKQDFGHFLANDVFLNVEGLLVHRDDKVTLVIGLYVEKLDLLSSLVQIASALVPGVVHRVGGVDDTLVLQVARR